MGSFFRAGSGQACPSPSRGTTVPPKPLHSDSNCSSNGFVTARPAAAPRPLSAFHQLILQALTVLPCGSPLLRAQGQGLDRVCVPQVAERGPSNPCDWRRHVGGQLLPGCCRLRVSRERGIPPPPCYPAVREEVLGVLRGWVVDLRSPAGGSVMPEAGAASLQGHLPTNRIWCAWHTPPQMHHQIFRSESLRILISGFQDRPPYGATVEDLVVIRPAWVG